MTDQQTHGRGRGVVFIVLGIIVGVFALFRLSVIIVTPSPSVYYALGGIIAVVVIAAISIALIVIGIRRRTRR